MGNDPINGIDPDGGWETKWGQFWAWVGNGFQGDRFTSESATGQGKYGIAFDYGGGSGEGDLSGTFMATSGSGLKEWNTSNGFNNYTFSDNGFRIDDFIVNNNGRQIFWDDIKTGTFPALRSITLCECL